MIFPGQGNLPLFGSDDWGDAQSYWTYIAGCPQSNTRQYADPYGYIDGGCPPDAYQVCCLSQPWKGAALAVRLMPVMMPVWNDSLFLQYVDRWVNHGLWTQPDSCAPAKGTYGVDYGPDSQKPGDCIRDKDTSDGIGRFPDKHGNNKDDGYYGSSMVGNMWVKYRATLSVRNTWTKNRSGFLAQSKIISPNPIKIALLSQYLQINKNIMVYDLAGNMIDKNNLRQAGIYLVKKADGGAMQKVMMVK